MSRDAVSCAASWPAACAAGGPPAVPAAAAMTGPDPGHGHDQRAARRGRGPGRARPLGRRPDHRHRTQSAVGTLVERTTRFVLLLHLPAGHDAAPGPERDAHAIGTLPGTLARSVTWDQGKEMSEHAAFTIATGIPVYFCDPHSPWQRGSNENTNGLLRQYLPKGTDLSGRTRRRPGCHRRQPQRPPPQDPRLYDTIGKARRVPCAHRLKPPVVSFTRARG